MAGRKRFNATTALYEVDARYRREMLGPPGDPKTHVAKLLAKLRDKKLDFVSEIVEQIKSQFPSDYRMEGDKLRLENPEFTALLFEAATQLDAVNRASDRAIQVAFNKAGLNVASPLDWRLLLEMFCWAHFGERGKPGKTVVWTDEKYCRLLRDVHQAKTKLKTNKDAAALRKIRETKFHEYPFNYDRLKKALAEARDLNYNTVLKKPTYDLLLQEGDASSDHGEHMAFPSFEDGQSVRRWLAEKDVAAEERRARRVKATARLMADRIGAGESF